MQFLRRGKSEQQDDGSGGGKASQQKKGDWLGSMFKTESLTEILPLPASVFRDAAIAKFHDHAFYLSCDPCFKSFTPKPESESETADDLPAEIRAKAAVPGARLRCYEVTDFLPNPVWSSTIINATELLDLDDGLFVRIRSALGTVLEARWHVREKKEAGGGGGLEILHHGSITCSRAILPFARANIKTQQPLFYEALVKGIVGDGGERGELGGGEVGVEVDGGKVGG